MLLALTPAEPIKPVPPPQEAASARLLTRSKFASFSAAKKSVLAVSINEVSGRIIGGFCNADRHRDSCKLEGSNLYLFTV